SYPFPYTTLFRSQEIDVTPQRRRHPGVTRHAETLVRLRMDAEANLAGRVHAVDRRNVPLGEQFAPAAVGEDHHFRNQLVERRTALARRYVHPVVLDMKRVFQYRATHAGSPATRFERPGQAPQGAQLVLEGKAGARPRGEGVV